VPQILPFAGYRFDLDMVASLDAVTSPPYDVISDEEQQHYRALSPWNVVRLECNDKHLDAESRAARYTESATSLQTWISEGSLRQDERSFYPYEMEFALDGQRRTVRGLICSVGVEPWGGSIVPHEHVMSRLVDERLGLMHQTRANFSPIYAVCSNPADPLGEVLSGLGEPESTVVDEEGTTHRLWRLPDPSIPDLLSGDDLLIADGHHRYTVALAYREAMRAAHGPGPWDEVMMFVVDAAVQDLPVLPIHRLLRSPAPLAGPAVEHLSAAIDSADDDVPSVGLIGPGPAYSTIRLSGGPPAVSALHDGPLAGMEGGRELVFTPDATEADRSVREGEAAMAVLLPPTTAERIRSVIDGGRRMPQKSTFFWPKPRTGMVLRVMPEPAP